jgi:hypothetical protein
MIYILAGNDNKKKSAYLKKLYKNNLPVVVPQTDLNKEIIFDYAGSVSLFGGSPVVVLDNVFKSENFTLSSEDLEILKDSTTTFVFIEDKLPAMEAKKYKKYGIIEDFNTAVLKQAPKTNVFGIADAFARRDKIGTWVIYREAILQGSSPEEISGIIFWKIKTMLLNGTKVFGIDELKKISSELVDLYHKAHRGDCDFTIGLEQFILSTLSK